MRMSRFEWLAKFFRPALPRVRPKREPCAEAELRSWMIGGVEFWAYTRSEARALAKARLGIRRKGRLPRGTVITEKVEQR